MVSRSPNSTDEGGGIFANQISDVRIAPVAARSIVVDRVVAKLGSPALTHKKLSKFLCPVNI